MFPAGHQVGVYVLLVLQHGRQIPGKMNKAAARRPQTKEGKEEERQALKTHALGGAGKTVTGRG